MNRGQRADLSGQDFNHWRVIEMSGKKDEQDRRLWTCECHACGHRQLVPTAYLRARPPQCQACTGKVAPRRQGVASFAEIARELGVSRQDVEVIYTRALRKLRRELNRRGLRVSDLLDAQNPEEARDAGREPGDEASAQESASEAGQSLRLAAYRVRRRIDRGQL